MKLLSYGAIVWLFGMIISFIAHDTTPAWVGWGVFCVANLLNMEERK